MIPIGVIILIAIGILVVVAQGGAQAKEEQRKKLRESAVEEGKRARSEGKAESACPYHDDNRDPGNAPVGAALVFNDGASRGQRYWWILAYRQADRELARVAQMQKPPEGTQHKPTEKNDAGSDRWFNEAVNQMVLIYTKDASHGRQGSEPKQELERIGKMLNEKGGMKLMRAAHAEFTRICQARDIRDSSGYISAPRSLEYRWNGIGSWMS